MKLTIIVLLFSLTTYASQWTVKRQSPYEIQALVESFNMDYLTQEEKNQLSDQLTELDSLMTSLEENDRFFLAKSTVYKWVLKSSPFVKIPKSFDLDKFKTNASTKDLSPFSKWLLMAIKSDIANLVLTTDYRSYLLEKQQKGRTIRFKAVKRRVDLIRPWAYLFTRENPQQISLRLVKYQFILLKNLISQYKLFYRFKDMELPQKPEQLSFFTLKENLNNDTSEADNTLTLLDQVIEKHQKANIPTPTSDWQVSKNDEWLPQNDESLTEESLRNLKNPSANPNYKAPVNLPKPVNDWTLD